MCAYACIRYAGKINFPFTVRSTEWPVPCLFHSLVICYLFKIRLYPFQPPFEVRVHFPSVSNHSYSFHILHVVVYDFYILLNSVHAGQQFVCGRKKDSESYRSDTDSLNACFTTLLNHTLCLCAFLLLYFRLCRSTVRQIMALALELL